MLTPEKEKEIRDIFSATGTLYDYEISELFEEIDECRKSSVEYQRKWQEAEDRLKDDRDIWEKRWVDKVERLEKECNQLRNELKNSRSEKEYQDAGLDILKLNIQRNQLKAENEELKKYKIAALIAKDALKELG